MKPAIIVGLDPGTTAGYAIIDIHGRVIEMNSARGIDLSSIIRDVISKGKVLAVASDKKKTPETVERFAVKTGGRLIWPDHDLLTDEKKELLKDFSGNTHEMDALASALYAYRRLESIIRKCINFAEREGIKDKEAELISLVVKHELNIKTAAELLMDKGPEKELVLQNIEEGNKDAKRLILLYSRLKTFSQRIAYLEKEKRDIEEKLSMQLRINRKLYKEMSKERIAQKICKASEEKDRKIHLLNESIERQRKELEASDKRNREQRKVIELSRTNIIARRIPTLSKKDLEEVKDDDVLLIDNPQEFSMSALKGFKGLILVGRRFPLEVRRTLYTVGQDEIKILLLFDSYAVIEKKSFEAAKKKEIFEKVISDYRKERAS